MARQDAGSRRRGRGDSDEDYERDSAADRAASRAEGGGGAGGGGGARLQSSPHIGVTKVRRACQLCNACRGEAEQGQLEVVSGSTT